MHDPEQGVDRRRGLGGGIGELEELAEEEPFSCLLLAFEQVALRPGGGLFGGCPEALSRRRVRADQGPKSPTRRRCGRLIRGRVEVPDLELWRESLPILNEEIP